MALTAAAARERAVAGAVTVPPVAACAGITAASRAMAAPLAAHAATLRRLLRRRVNMRSLLLSAWVTVMGTGVVGGARCLCAFGGTAGSGLRKARHHVLRR